jgi:hypothetical protein
VRACLSHDVVVHETTHALLDGLRNGFSTFISEDQAAFHEGFADIVALLSVFAQEPVVDHALDVLAGTEHALEARAHPKRVWPGSRRRPFRARGSIRMVAFELRLKTEQDKQYCEHELLRDKLQSW